MGCSTCKTVIQKIFDFLKSPMTKRCIACVSCSLYFTDVGSDGYSGYDLWVDGQVNYSAWTFGWIFVPGVIYGIYFVIDGVKNGDWKKFVAGITAPVWLIPYTAWTQLKNVWIFSEESINHAKT